MKFKLFTSVAFLSLLAFSCDATKEAVESKADISIEAEAFLEQFGDIEKIENGVKSNGHSWIGFDVDVKEIGRYKVEVTMKGDGQVWLEDYVQNPDNRTYNITGKIEGLGTDEFSVVAKDGSPLNIGTHKMRLHFEGNDVQVDKIELTKMIDHQFTPQTLTQSTTGDQWELVWSDEFEGEGLPDSTKWIYDVGNWGWGNNEPQYYTANRTENARLEGGNLIIEARKNDMGQEWTSARLTTRGKTSFLYGKIEFRGKAPSKDGTWAAGWLLGDDYRDELSWPYCGEIDVLECVGSEIDDITGDGINHASCHTRTYYFKENTSITAVTNVVDMTNTFHNYTIEWTPDGVKAFLDGKEYYHYDKTKDALEWPFDKPQNIILNLAMGGGMGGAIDPSIDRQQFILDYVRVYELK
ncbi:MAG: beta-glucanase (GH16 family) [Roseivirga sp.]|jgi:beta-glucanase (GH16 family)